jgi:hypothetical protein
VEAWKVLMDLTRKMSPAEKLQRALELSWTVRLAAEAGLRESYPHASDREIFLRSARQNLGAELFRKVYGEELADDRSAERDAQPDHCGV